jgi:rhomboid protease GluP
LNSKEDFLFWRLAQFFICECDYRLIQIKESEQELWLENAKNKQGKIIRLVRENLDWSNWLQRDMEAAAAIGEQYRRRFLVGDLRIINVYITPYPPVDDYLFRIEKPFKVPGGKTEVHTLLLMPDQLHQTLQQLGTSLGFSVPIMLEKEEYDQQEVLMLKQQTLAEAARQARQEQAVFENGRPFFTFVFLILQIAAMILMEFFGGSTNSATLIKFGAKFNPLIIEGEWWRFITPIFLHIGFLHLFMNSLSLFYLGPLVERIYGNVRFLWIYLFSGFAGSLASFALSPHLSAGASGAIFGCFGALLYFGVIYPKLFFRTMGTSVLFVIALNLVFGFTVQGIDNAGHIGGLIGGFLASGLVHFPKKKKPLLQLLFFLISSALVFCFLQYGYGEKNRTLDAKSSLILAQTYVEQGDYDRAYEVLKNAAKENAESADVLFLLSYIEIKKGLVKEAKVHLHKVIELDSEFHEAYYNLALLAINDDDLHLAKRYAEHALKLKPESLEYRKLVKEIDGYLNNDSAILNSI